MNNKMLLMIIAIYPLTKDITKAIATLDSRLDDIKRSLALKTVLSIQLIIRIT